jgi:hypothetical protein
MKLYRHSLFTFPTQAMRCLYPRYIHSMLHSHALALALCLSSVPALLPAQSFAQEEAGGASSGSHNQRNEDCPPGTRGPFSSCAEYWEAINKEALRLGYADSGGNGIADFLETYVRNEHDCADVAAEVACVSNQSECIEQVAKQYRSNMANHSDNYVEGIGECDFTPMRSGSGYIPNKGQAGGGLADNADTTIDEGAPDPGETVDPAYTCSMNGANRRNVGSGIGGMGGAASNMAMMMAISQLLNGMNGVMSGGSGGLNGSGQNEGTPAPTPNPIAIATPTCTPMPTPGRTLPTPISPKAAPGYNLSDNSNSFSSDFKDTAPAKPKAKPLDADVFSNVPAEEGAAKQHRPNPAWSEFNEDIFDPQAVL